MTSDAKAILSCLFDVVWRLFTSWDIPGTEITPAEFLFFLAFAGLSLRFLFRILGIVPDVSLIHIERPNGPLASDSSAAPRLNAPGGNRGVFGHGPGWSWTHRD